jgi:glucose/arabinose dehydrogenase
MDDGIWYLARVAIPNPFFMVLKRYFQWVLSAFVCLGAVEVYGQSGAKVYATYCAGCHGAQLQGSAATALIKKNWQHGGDRASILKTIRDGVPGTEMVKWGAVLSEKDLALVTDYIVQAQTAPVVKATEKPLTVETKLYKLNIERVVTEGLKGPWGMEFVDAHRMLITGKTGELYWVVDGKLDAQKIQNVPQPYAYDNFGGLMDVALDPDYAANGWVYLGLSFNAEGSKDKMTPGMTKIVRGKITNHRWTSEETLFQVHDSLRVVGGSRWGCRFLFDQGKHLYFTIGDMNRAQDAQILSRPSGKIYRINRDGSIPKDNPLYGKEGLLQAIYSWGNRNAQGLAQHPVTGQIYASEHGPQGGDELNIIRNGANYGWPVITYGIDYNGSIISNDTHMEGMEQPVTYWTPSIAVSAIAFVTGKKFPKWQNNLLVTALKYEEVRRLVIDGDKVLEQEVLLKGYGRVRDVKVGPDGALYVLTNAPDALLRITPTR